MHPRSIFFYFVAIVFFSCSNNEQNIRELNIEIPSDKHFLLEKIIVHHPILKEIKADEFKYDLDTKNFIYTLENISTDEVELTYQTLNGSFRKKYDTGLEGVINIPTEINNQYHFLTQIDPSDICTPNLNGDAPIISLDQSLLQHIEKDTTYLIRKSNGCLHTTKETYRFYVSGNGFIFERQNGNTGKYETGQLIEKPEFLKQYQKFESSVNDIGPGGCTTQDYYAILNGSRILQFIDPSCKWNGFTDFMESLNPSLKN